MVLATLFYAVLYVGSFSCKNLILLSKGFCPKCFKFYRPGSYPSPPLNGQMPLKNSTIFCPCSLRKYFDSKFNHAFTDLYKSSFFTKMKSFLVQNFYLNFVKKGKCILNTRSNTWRRFLNTMYKI